MGCATDSPPPYDQNATAAAYGQGAGPWGQQQSDAGTAAPAGNRPTYTTRQPVGSEPKPWENSARSAVTAQYPKATKVSGKPGLVKSPYAPYAGDVDVSGIASGNQAKCPYTGKIFVVP